MQECKNVKLFQSDMGPNGGANLSYCSGPQPNTSRKTTNIASNGVTASAPVFTGSQSHRAYLHRAELVGWKHT